MYGKRGNTVKETSKNESKENLERAEKMFNIYKTGVPLEKIAPTFKITRERIRQILTKTYGQEYLDVVKLGRDIRRLPEYVENTCVKCKKVFQSHRGVQMKKYCSRDCRIINKYPSWVGTKSIRKDNFTEDEWKEINRIRANAYYHRNIEVRRKKSSEYQKKNKVTQALYAKRWAERKIHGKAITPLPVIKNKYAMKE